MNIVRPRVIGLSQVLIVICAVVWLVCAIRPWDVEAWLLEQVATVCALAVLMWCLRAGIRFSTGSQICIAAMIVAHTVGTHFTYSLTPYDEFIKSITSVSVNELFGWQRNHYDRFVHLLFGLLVSVPTAEAVQQRLQLRASTAAIMSVHIILSTSALYELLEWTAALTFGADLGNHYLGTQGDVWDAQADIALAGAGSVAAFVAWFTTARR